MHPPPPHQPGPISPSSLNVRQKAAVDTLCTLWLKPGSVGKPPSLDVLSLTSFIHVYSVLYNPVRYGQSRCRVDVSPTDASPTENSWMLRPLNKASLRYCVPDRCVPTLDRVNHKTSSVGRYRGLGRPPAPNESVGRLAGFAYAPDQVY